MYNFFFFFFLLQVCQVTVARAVLSNIAKQRNIPLPEDEAHAHNVDDGAAPIPLAAEVPEGNLAARAVRQAIVTNHFT